MEYEEGGAKTVDRGIGAPYSEISYLRHTQYAAWNAPPGVDVDDSGFLRGEIRKAVDQSLRESRKNPEANGPTSVVDGRRVGILGCGFSWKGSKGSRGRARPQIYAWLAALQPHFFPLGSRAEPSHARKDISVALVGTYRQLPRGIVNYCPRPETFSAARTFRVEQSFRQPT
ncbi:hypothetical protein K0M31_010744 [Melipona bicolor]|uniref:Uncharacterized protein n=1 Tax=Melipona bicolor TaxID=60889 RepID=A0AA40KHW7_9HYME|nr:hypothetical protein K0M31_010744 [Melipona bicolor]